MLNPSDHELNEVLARVAGIELGWLTYPVDWNPLHDANQMERVKEALRGSNIDYRMEYSNYLKDHLWAIEEDDSNTFYGKNESELRAFALAVHAMDQSQKGTT